MCASYDDILKLSNVLKNNEDDDDNYAQDVSDTSSVDSQDLTTNKSSDCSIDCDDPLIRHALLLNSRKRQALTEIIRKIEDRLLEINHIRNECRVRLFNHGKARRSKQNKIKKRLGTPYFKDINAFPSPPNSDWLEMKENKQLQEHQILRVYWTQEDKCNLMRGVFNAICTQKIQELNNLIKFSDQSKVSKQFIEEMDIFTNSDLLKTLMEKWRTLSYLHSLSSEEQLIVNTVINWDEKLDWLQISSQFFDGRHTDNECRAMWNCYINPKYSKEYWTDNENNKLITIGEKYNYQNWEAIAKDMPTRRSAYQCCVHFHVKLCEKFNSDKWTPEENRYLQSVIEDCTIGSYISWGRVAYYFKHRNKRQICRHYSSCGGKNIKKGAFSMEEDILLLTLLTLFKKNYARIKSYFPDRLISQLRRRVKTLSMDVGRPWSIQEDSAIIAHVAKNGQKNWGLLKEINRPEDCIRHRYRTIHSFLETRPGSTVLEIPRRCGTKYRGNIRQRVRIVHKLVKEMLDAMQINFREEMLSLQYIKRALKPFTKDLEDKAPKSKKKSTSTINELLEQFFKNSYRCVVRTPVIYTEEMLDDSAGRIESLLKMLEANFTFPSLEIIDSHPELDDIDKQIIQRIVNKNQQNESLPSTSWLPFVKCIPPSIENLIGFRGLLLHTKTLKLHAGGKYTGYAVYCKTDPHSKFIQHGFFYNKSCLDNLFAKTNEKTKRIVLKNEQLFMKRLMILFQWAYVIADTKIKPVKIEKVKGKKPGPKPKGQKFYKIHLMNQARKKAAEERRRLKEAAGDEVTTDTRVEQKFNKIDLMNQAWEKSAEDRKRARQAAEDEVPAKKNKLDLQS